MTATDQAEAQSPFDPRNIDELVSQATRFCVLARIGAGGADGATYAELTEALRQRHANITSALRPLQEAGLVAIERGFTDAGHRQTRPRLTPDGKVRLIAHVRRLYDIAATASK